VGCGALKGEVPITVGGIGIGASGERTILGWFSSKSDRPVVAVADIKESQRRRNSKDRVDAHHKQ